MLEYVEDREKYRLDGEDIRIEFNIILDSREIIIFPPSSADIQL
jgi:hypothetical protein